MTTPLEYATKVSCHLVQHKIAHRLLQRVDAVLQTKSEQPVSWHDPDGSINLRRFVDIVNKLENQALRVALFKLKDAAIMDDDQQQQHLLMCRSPGVMCAIAAELPHIYLDGPPPTASSKVVLPQEMLEIDMRGRMHIARDGTFAHIDLGEIETQPEYADAVKKLGIRLATIGWFVQVCFDVRNQDVRLVGRLLLPKSSLGARFVASDQSKRAAREWNYGLYVHGF